LALRKKALQRSHGLVSCGAAERVAKFITFKHPLSAGARNSSDAVRARPKGEKCKITVSVTVRQTFMFNANISAGMVIGFIGVALSLCSFSMRNMQSLRQIAIFSNMAFIVYGIIEFQLPTIVLSSILLPLNGWRLFQIKRLVKDIESAKADAPVSEWLLPHMTVQSFPAGHVLFEKGAPADEIYYIHTGAVRLIEIDITLQAGELFGEIGIFSSTRQRTVGVVCETDCKLYTLTRDALYKIYYQQPKLGFHLISLIVNRLTAGMDSSDVTTRQLAGLT
jgi:hypothetical protein